MSEQTQPIEEVVEETVQETKTVEETPQEEASYKEVKKDGTIKLDLGKLKKFQTQNKEENVRKEESIKEDKQEESDEEKVSEEVLQEVTDEPEQTVAQVAQKQEVTEEKITPQPEVKLPENIESLVKFMEETGGTIEEYVRLNADYSNVDNNTLIREYYKQTRPHLDYEDINLLLEDYSYDEELDEEKDIRKKKIAYKEEVGKAKNFLEGLKDKYYDEIKLRPGVNQDQQKAMDFFNRYNEEQKNVKQMHEDFVSRTKSFLTDDFKGFDFNVGDKKFRYGVKNPPQIANDQADITNFIGTFLDKENKISDLSGYHKALYAARNADTIASHFYEQGKADAVKDVMAKSKNISTDARPTVSGDVYVKGFKVKAVSGADSSRLKIKTKRFNK